MNKGEVLKIVDKCFRSYASSYRHDAKELAEKLIDDLENNQGQELPIDSVSKCTNCDSLDFELISCTDFQCNKCGNTF